MFIPPGFVNVNYRFARTGDNELMITSFGYSWDEVVDPNDFANDMFNAWLDSDMRAITSEDTSLSSVTCEFGTIGDGNLVSESNESPGAGTSSDEPLPQNCALLVKKLTGLGGRANRGRNYYPDVSQNGTNALGMLDAATQVNYADGWLDWGANRGAVDGVLASVLFHTPEDSIPTLLTGFAVQQQIATQRRRLRP